MGMKKSCSCGCWNQEQQECLYAGSGCIRDEDRKLEVTEDWILEWERRLTHYAMGLTYKEANREIRTMLKEIGISVA